MTAINHISRQVRDLPAAIEVVEQLEELDQYLDRLSPVDRNWPKLDQRTLHRAIQLEREASALLRAMADPTTVVSDVGPVVDRGARLARRLPPPTPRATTARKRIAPSPGAALPSLGLSSGAVAPLAQALRGGSLQSGTIAAFLLTLVVGVWSGLEALYFGEAWGSGLDFFAAAAWGFGASTVIAPTIAALQQWATRPADDAPSAR